jgi:hypothetical protein
VFDVTLAELVAEARRDRAAGERDGWARADQAFGDHAAKFLAWAYDRGRWSFIVTEAKRSRRSAPRRANQRRGWPAPSGTSCSDAQLSARQAWAVAQLDKIRQTSDFEQRYALQMALDAALQTCQ